MAKIFLVEDDPTLLDMYSLKFKEDGFDISTAANGEEGLEQIIQRQPDVVLLDIMMPKMDGFAVLTALKKNEATKNIPVILLSNLGQQADIDKGKALGATDYVVKASLTPTQLVATAKKYLTK